MSLLAALSSLQWSVKNTFVHCNVGSPEQHTAPGSKWKLQSDITAARDQAALGYLRSFMSGAVAPSETSPEENAVEALEAADADLLKAPEPFESTSLCMPVDGRGDGLQGEELPMQCASISAGAAGHYEGSCKPCAWNWRPGGCSKGEACEFCHLCEEGTFKQRRRQKINRLRAEEKAAKRAQKAMAMATSESHSEPMSTRADA